MGSINGLSIIQSTLNSALQSVGSKSPTSSNSLSAVTASQPDSFQASPLAQVLSTLQQLQQSNPAEYQQVTAQISKNLQTAAQTATSEGNTTAATQLNQLSEDFTKASTTGQLPNIQNLAQAVGGGGKGHHHHHHHVSSSSDSDSTSSSTSSSGSSSDPATSTDASQNSDLNPLSIIVNTLANATQNNGQSPA